MNIMRIMYELFGLDQTGNLMFNTKLEKQEWFQKIYQFFHKVVNADIFSAKWQFSFKSILDFSNDRIAVIKIFEFDSPF